jgi:hypothetical protein
MSKKIIYGVILQTMAVYGATAIVPDDDAKLNMQGDVLDEISALVNRKSLNENVEIADMKREIRRTEGITV